MKCLALAVTALLPLCASFEPCASPTLQGSNCPSTCIADAVGYDVGNWHILHSSALLVNGSADILCRTCQGMECKALLDCHYSGEGSWAATKFEGPIVWGAGEVVFRARLQSDCDDLTPDYVILADYAVGASTTLTLFCPCTPQ